MAGIRCGEQVLQVVRAAHLAALPGERGVRVQGAQRGQCPVELGAAQVVLAEEGLPVEVGQFDDVRFDAVQMAHAGRHEVTGGRPAGAADADEQHAGVAQP